MQQRPRTATIEPRFSLGRLLAVVAVAAVALAMAPQRARSLAIMPPAIAALAMVICRRLEFQLILVVLLLLTALIFPAVDPDHRIWRELSPTAAGPSRALRPIPPLPRTVTNPDRAHSGAGLHPSPGTRPSASPPAGPR